MVKIIRDTKTVRQERTLKELKSLLDRLPRLGKEGEAFERDIMEIGNQQPYLLGFSVATHNVRDLKRPKG